MDHSGHRARLRRAYSENGLEAFAPHEVIELILYAALPRRDVNELAHRLSDTFGGVPGLMNADAERLMSEGGLTRNTAEIISAVAGCARALAADDGRGDVFINTRADAERLKTSQGMVLLNSGRRVIFTSPVPDETPDRYIYAHAMLYDASGVILSGIKASDALRARLAEAGTEVTEI